MEDWSKNLFEVIETAALEVENFFNEMSEEISEVFDEWGKFSEEITEEIRTNFIVEIDEYLNDLIDPIIEVYLDLDFDVGGEDIDYFVDRVEPTVEEHPACRGCNNYHGQVYGGNLLVCGMHPYGVEGETCPDWESDNSNLN
ncbi:MAG: hypothetical protein F6K18_02365 [Okeania sp. SIO2C2]|uniref:Uncharacterized protein n=1 Tax=Okeania hirsuta TaxID=1458930 RepID=A0A3N6PIE6_9CYAN|nr:MULTISPECIES: hypothetical protein [Okeania]NEP85757.1 hypothetical protein [Okeania sp. SIO2C2]NES88775.1 hypothetical protein [Okeania sp. SIO2B9]NET75129.1 hypothetical protein [Okeania sp. SIO1F9]RQH25712.1 hypothetical protein D4Z78_02230 [Okeania hirsuta]RQH51443.1 hypothetical protein D5R40_05615 [Okeania hirsuta]